MGIVSGIRRRLGVCRKKSCEEHTVDWSPNQGFCSVLCYVDHRNTSGLCINPACISQDGLEESTCGRVSVMLCSNYITCNAKWGGELDNMNICRQCMTNNQEHANWCGHCICPECKASP